LGLPYTLTRYTLTRSPLRRLAPFAWLTRWRSFAQQTPVAFRHRSAQLRMWIADRREVRRARTRVEIGEQAVVALVRLRFCHAARRIVEVAKDDGIGRARRRAGRHYLAVPYLAIMALRVDPRVIDALDAVRALLHDAAASHRDVGIPQRLEARRRPVLEEQEVE